MTKSNLKIQDLTGVEVMTHVLLWVYNWREEDFKKAFKDSSIGWDYHWKKLQRELENEKGATSAIVNVILNMDAPHIEMLYTYIMNKSAHTIESAREWNMVLAAHQEQENSKES